MTKYVTFLLKLNGMVNSLNSAIFSLGFERLSLLPPSAPNKRLPGWRGKKRVTLTWWIIPIIFQVPYTLCKSTICPRETYNPDSSIPPRHWLKYIPLIPKEGRLLVAKQLHFPFFLTNMIELRIVIHPAIKNIFPSLLCTWRWTHRHSYAQ